jgi:hypothetical protein
MNRIHTKITTYLLIFSLVFQNIVFAGGDKFLAPDSKKDLAQIAGALFTHHGEKDCAWEDFKGMGMPFEIRPEVFERSNAIFECIGTDIMGDIGNDGLFHIPTEIEKRLNEPDKELIKSKVNHLIQVIGAVFEEGTRIKIITNTRRSLFYNKDDNVLEINALLVLDGVSEQLQLFCISHEMRHKQMTGLSPSLEECVNIYMDFEYLDSLDAQMQTDILSELEGIDASGYAVLLRKRNNRNIPLRQEELFKDICAYILMNCPWVTDKLHLTGDMQVQIQRMVKLLNKEKAYLRNLYNYVCALSNSASVVQFPENLLQSLPVSAAFLYRNLDSFTKLEEDIIMVSGLFKHGSLSIAEIAAEGSITEIYAKSLIKIMLQRGIIFPVYTELTANAGTYMFVHKDLISEFYVAGYDVVSHTNIFIPRNLQNEVNAKRYILWQAIHEELKKRDFTEKEILEIEDFFKNASIPSHAADPLAPLTIALKMAKAGASKTGIKAGFVIFQNSPYVSPEISRILNNYEQVKKVAEYDLYMTRHMIQNTINLMIQFSEGNADVFFLVICEKIYELENFANNPEKFSALTDEERSVFQQSIEWLFVPIAEFLDSNDLADTMRSFLLRIFVGNNFYEDLLEKDVGAKAGFTDIDYNELKEVFKKITDIIAASLSEFPVKVNGRVKTPYAVYNKTRAVKDVFGIRIEITGEHSLEEERQIRDNISKRLSKLMKISEEDKKKLQDKDYNEYDFIATLNLGCLEFRELFLRHTAFNVTMEVQIYPTEDDFRRSQFGPAAHWLYKLLTTLKRYGIENQMFDRDILEKLYKRFKKGDFGYNLRLVFDELKKFKYIAVIKDGTLRIIRANSRSLAPDIAGALIIDSFDLSFVGLKKVGGTRCLSNTDPSELVPDIYEIEQKKGGLSRDDLLRIRDKTSKPRTYFLISKILAEEKGDVLEADGKKLFEDCMKAVGHDLRDGGIDADYINYIVRNLLVIERYMGRGVSGIVTKVFSLRRLETFYKMITLLNKPGGEAMLEELTKRAYHYMTRDELPAKIGLDKLREKWDIGKELPNVAVLIYLFTIEERGKKYLKKLKMLPASSDDNITKRLLVLLDEFAVDDLFQLYAKIGLDEVLAEIVKLRLQSIIPPVVSITLDPDFSTGVIDSIQDAVDRCGLEITDIKHTKEGFELSLIPGRYWIEKVDTLLQAIRSLKDVKAAEIIYEDPGLIQTNLQLDVEHWDLRLVENNLRDLFEKLKIRCDLQQRTGKRLTYHLMVPEHITHKNLKNILVLWLKDKLGKNTVIDRIKIKSHTVPEGSLKGLMFIPTFGSGLNIPYVEYVIILALVIVVGVISWKYIRGNVDMWRRGILKETFYKKPKALLLDVGTIKDLTPSGRKVLIQAINNVNGKVAIMCSDETKGRSAIEDIVRGFWDENIGQLNPKVIKKLNNILGYIYLQGDAETKDSFAKRVYVDVQKKFKINPENISVFTSAREFIETWRDIAKESLLLVLAKDIMFITSEKLRQLQDLSDDKKGFEFIPGEKIELLPEYFYGEGALKELERIEAEQAA